MHMLVAVTLVLFVVACSGGPGTSDDASIDAVDDHDGTAIEAPALPAPPASPVFTPCPDGWREVEDPDTGIVTCDPWPEGGPEECGPDEAHFPGEPGCVRIGTACPTGDWADDLPTDREILYVRAGEPSGGDGTRDAPFGTIADAMAEADPLTVIALSKGTFDEVVILMGGITLWGACVAETVVSCSEPSETSSTINVVRSDSSIRNLTVSGERSGIEVLGDRTVDIEDVVISGSISFGLYITDGGQATCRSLVVRDTRATGGGQFGRGLNVATSGRAEVTRAVFENNRELGVAASNVDVEIVLHDVAILDTQCQVLGRNYGNGLFVQAGAHVEVQRSVFERNHEYGVLAKDPGTRVELLDFVVRDTISRELDGQAGVGVAVQNADVSMSRGVIEWNRGSGVYASGVRTNIELADIVVRDTQGRDHDGQFGEGLLVEDGVEARVMRGVFARNHYMGIILDGADASLELTDVMVLDTRSDAFDSAFGRGLSIHGGASCDATRCSLERNREMGVFTEGAGTSLVMTDVSILDTLSLESDGLSGNGLIVSDGSRVEMLRGIIEGNRETGVFACHEGTTVLLADVVISDTLERACAEDTCTGYGAGTGIGVFASAHVDMSRFLITRNAFCGVQLARGLDADWEYYDRGGTIDLHDGVISHNPVGANVQTEGFDIDRLMDGVLFFENGANLDVDELPVPEFGL